MPEAEDLIYHCVGLRFLGRALVDNEHLSDIGPARYPCIGQTTIGKVQKRTLRDGRAVSEPKTRTRCRS
jgi:hypothetical protein